MACKSLDGQVAVPTDRELDDLLGRFVCVRMVQMWGIDLSRFQFDGALTWAIFLMNADGTIYGRYGSRSGLREESARDISLAGFKESLRGALALHDEYGKDRKSLAASLAAKTGSAPPWKTPESIPELKSRGRFTTRFTGTRTRQRNCIHCHMIPGSEIPSLRAAGRPIPDRMFWPYPMPDEIGLRMDPGEMATVEKVVPGSIAGTAGFRAGDRILRLAGQPVISTADIQWVLHNTGDSGTIEAQVDRGGERRTVRLSLKAGWRHELDDWRFFNAGYQRRLIQFACRPVPRGERRSLGLDGETLALRVERVPGELARRKNIRQGDVVVAVDGKRDPMTFGAFTAWLYREKSPGDTLELTLLRDGRERRVRVEVR